jgi:signal transduction histidine kinase
VGTDNSALSLVEEQLLRITGSECMAYLPMMAGKSCLGVLVYGMSSFQIDELWGREQFLQLFATQAATSLELSTAARDEIDKYITRVAEEHRDASRRVIHEVNNPLSIIKNYLSVLDDKLAMHEPVKEELSVLGEEIDRVSRIVGGLSESQPIQQEETTEINAVLNDVVRLFTISRFLPTSVSIVVRTADQAANMAGAADTLKQIILNLIKNAIEALPRGGKIEVKNIGRTIREGRSYFEVHISDNGAGIPADILPNLFSAVNSSKKGENRGVGLSIVQSLVTKINGLISCRSGKYGTTFEILLPAYEASAYARRELMEVTNGAQDER